MLRVMRRRRRRGHSQRRRGAWFGTGSEGCCPLDVNRRRELFLRRWACLLQASPSLIQRLNPAIRFSGRLCLNIIRPGRGDDAESIDMFLERDGRDAVDLRNRKQAQELVLLVRFVVGKLSLSKNKPAFLPGLQTPIEVRRGSWRTAQIGRPAYFSTLALLEEVAFLAHILVVEVLEFFERASGRLMSPFLVVVVVFALFAASSRSLGNRCQLLLTSGAERLGRRSGRRQVE